MKQNFSNFVIVSKLQFNSLTFVSGFKRATDEGSLSEIAQYSPSYIPLNVLLLPKDQTFIFYYTTHLPIYLDSKCITFSKK